MHTCHRARTSLFLLRSNIPSCTDSHIHTLIHSRTSTPPVLITFHTPLPLPLPHSLQSHSHSSHPLLPPPPAPTPPPHSHSHSHPGLPTTLQHPLLHRLSHSLPHTLPHIHSTCSHHLHHLLLPLPPARESLRAPGASFIRRHGAPRARTPPPNAGSSRCRFQE